MTWSTSSAYRPFTVSGSGVARRTRQRPRTAPVLEAVAQ